MEKIIKTAQIKNISLMRRALGADWEKLPLALQAHYQGATNADTGHMDIEYPWFMQPVYSLLRLFGALPNRRGQHIATVVRKHIEDGRQHWRRTITYADGRVIHFNSIWEVHNNHLIEYVNPLLGVEMAPYVVGDQLHYRGVRFVLRLGPLKLSIPEWLALGHTTIVEKATSASEFEMDFRLTHPLFGQVFRYSGKFQNRVDANEDIEEVAA
jgi:hypothetical protein